MEQGLFFPSKNGDRKYKASDFTGYFAKLFSNGIFSNNSENLQVFASETNGLSVSIQPGYGNVNGYLYQMTEGKTVLFDISDVSGTAKKGAVVLRLDLNERELTVVAKGNDNLTRTDTIYEMMLARIDIPGNGKAITQSMIQDTRGNGALCGYVSSLLDIDPTTLWIQFEADWKKWLEEIKGTVGNDAAANLALAVDELKKEIKLLQVDELRKALDLFKVEVTNKLLTKQNVIKDSGWIKLETTGVVPANGRSISYRKVGNQIFLRGGGRFPVEREKVFFTLPVEMRPSQEVRFYQVTEDSVINVFLFRITTEGKGLIVYSSQAINSVTLDNISWFVN